MEFNRTMKDCRNGYLPKEFEDKNPILSILIKKMINNDPNLRPNLYVIIII
jgi:hypothetical protein